MKRDKSNIIVCQGHLYLFWTTGVYYTAQLAERFNVILLVPESYRDDERFKQISETLNLHHIEYYPFVGNSRLLHQQVADQFKALISEHRPEAVVQHDYLGLENMYLAHFAEQSEFDCRRVVVLSSMPSTPNTKALLEEFLLLSVERYANKLRLPIALLKPLVKLSKYAYSFWSNKVLPSLVLKTTPYFPLSRYNNIDILPNRALFDKFLVYAPCEQQYLQNLFKSNDLPAEQPFPLAAFPIRDQWALVARLCPIEQQPVVTLLPSLLGIRNIHKDKNNLNIWIDATKILKSKLPNHKFQIKFHPGVAAQSMKVINNAFLEQCDFLEVVDNKVMAEQLIRQSEFVVGDVTTSLWWTYFHGDKLAISLAMEHYASAADMKDYPGVLFVEQLQQLQQADLNELREQQRNTEAPDKYPTIAEIVAKCCEK